MTKKQKQKKKIEEITNGMAKQCQITPKPKFKPSGNTFLDEDINPELLAKWPKLSLKVPPIFIHQPIDFEQHVKKVLQMGIKFYKPHLTNNYTKVRCETFNDHKHLTHYLDKKQLPYHTYGNPSKRKMKVVIRGLPKDTDLNIIKEELKSVSVPVIRVHKMQTKEERSDDTMLLLAVVPYDDEGKVILRLTKLLGHDVKLEPPKDKPKQCYRCQKWGHSQRYCHGPIRCVKCSGDHLSKKCEKKPEVDPKCANCGGAHTASYRKCKHALGSDDFYMMQTIKMLIPCYNPPELVTMDNYHMLYRNVDINNKKLAKSI